MTSTSLHRASEALPVPASFHYAPRLVIADDIVDVHSCRIKPYRIVYPPREDDPLNDAEFQKAILREFVQIGDNNLHDVGFSILHIAADGIYFLLARWYDGNNLTSRSYHVSGHVDSFHLKSVPADLYACVWEMAIYAHERNSWISEVMATGRGLAAADAYLACRIRGWA